MRVIVSGEYSRGKDARKYDNIVAYQEESNDFVYNVKLMLNDKEHAIVKSDGKIVKKLMDGHSDVFNQNNKVWSFPKGDDNTYQITYIDAHKLKGKLTIKLPKEGRIFDLPVGYSYKINSPEKFINIKSNDELELDNGCKYKTWTSNHVQSEINQAISSLVFSKMSGLLESTNWSQTADYLSRDTVNEIEEGGNLKRFGVSLISLSIDQQTLAEISQTLAEGKTDKESVETGDQVRKNQEEMLGRLSHLESGVEELKAVGDEIKALTKSEAEKGRLHTSKEAEGIKDFIAKRDGIIKDILENVKTGKGSGVSSEDIKKYFDITNATVAAEINKLIDKINAGKHLSDEEFVQATKAVECTDPKDLKNTPQLTLNFILDNTSKDWHASMAADVIYHQLEKWLSKKKITSAMFKAKELLEFFEQCSEVFDKNGKCILDKAFKKTGSKIEHKPFEQQDNWVLLEDVKGGIKPHNGLKCYFALLDNDVRKNDVKSSSKNTIYQCKKADEYWWQMNKMRHFGTQDSMKKLSEQGLSDIKARKERLIEITEFFKTGVFETEDVLADII